MKQERTTRRGNHGPPLVIVKRLWLRSASRGANNAGRDRPTKRAAPPLDDDPCGTLPNRRPVMPHLLASEPDPHPPLVEAFAVADTFEREDEPLFFALVQDILPAGAVAEVGPAVVRPVAVGMVRHLPPGRSHDLAARVERERGELRGPSRSQASWRRRRKSITLGRAGKGVGGAHSSNEAG